MKKIFVNYLGSLGDTFLIIPTLRAIKETHPLSKTILMVSPKTKNIFEGSPLVDEIIYYKKSNNLFPILKKIWKADLSLILGNNCRARQLAWLARIPQRLGFYPYPKKKRFLTIHIDKGNGFDKYEAECYLRLANCVGINTNDLSLEIPQCNQDEKEYVDNLLEKNLVPKDKFIVIAPYSSNYLKDWPEEKFNEVINHFKSIGYTSVLCGGSELEQTAERFKNAVYIPNLLTPRQSTYIMSLSRLVICGCTFVLHLASTTKTPIVAIYGPTSPKQWAPYANCTVIKTAIPCSPCKYYESTFTCALDKKCIKEITSKEVLEVALHVLKDE
jgi:ADP-heptose:LPS heptosyltransferase